MIIVFVHILYVGFRVFGYTQVYSGIPGGPQSSVLYVGFWVFGYTQVYSGILRYTQVYSGILRYTQVYNK